MSPIEPDQTQLADISDGAGGEADGPVVMLNLNRYRPQAAYAERPPGGASQDVSGRDAYERYGAVALGVLERVGGRILWHASAERTVIGGEGDRYDDVIAVWYPSRSAFLALVSAPEILAARVDRTAGLEQATLICCDPGDASAQAGS